PCSSCSHGSASTSWRTGIGRCSASTSGELMDRAPASNVLLVISADDEAPRATRVAIDLAKQRTAQLVAVVLLDTHLSARVADALTEVGFVSDEVSTNVGNTVLHERRARAEALLQLLTEHARKEGIDVTLLLEQGDTSEICNRVIRTHRIGT